MKFSIIVPCYNAIRYCQNIVDMLFSQSYKDYEVIIVDDCSLDDTFNHLNNLINNYSNYNIRIFQTNNNSGPGEARNFGLKQAQGEYILFCDSDDYFDISCLHTIDEFLSKKPEADMLVFPHDIVRGNKTFHNDTYTQYQNEQEISRCDIVTGCVGPVAKVFRKSIIDDNNISFPSRRTGEDACFLTWYVVHVKKAYKLAFSYYKYMMNNSSITHQKNVDLDEKTIFEILQPIYKEYFPTIEINEFVNNHLLSMAKKMTDAKYSCNKMRVWYKKENQKYPDWIKTINFKEQSLYRKISYIGMYYNMPLLLKLIMYIRRSIY